MIDQAARDMGIDRADLRRRNRAHAYRAAAIAHCSESEMFDLPEPFGPMITATPGKKRSSTSWQSRESASPTARRRT